MPIPPFPIPQQPYNAPHYLSPHSGNEWKASWSKDGVEETPSKQRRLDGGGVVKVQ